MTSRIVLGAVLVTMVSAPVALDAQFGGLLKKKATEVLKGKPAPPPEPAPEAPPPASSTAAPTSAAPATAAPAAETRTASRPPAAPAAPVDPLDLANFRLNDNATRLLREDNDNGELPGVPYFGKATTAALKALDDAGRVAFVEKAGAAMKALVTSDTFAAAHAEAIKQRYRAVDHGLKVSSPDQMMKKGDFAGFEAYNKRQQAAVIVENAEKEKAAEIKRIIPFQLDDWRKAAQTGTGKYKARNARIVTEADAILASSDEPTIRRKYALIRSLEIEGPDTEAALYALAEQGRKEAEQVAWDAHNLKAVLKQQLSAFTALVPTVDFTAKTVAKGERQVFVSAAHEKQGALWKACYRAGKPATTAVQQWAQAWLKEL